MTSPPPPPVSPVSLSAALANAPEGEVAKVLLSATFRPRLPGEWREKRGGGGKGGPRPPHSHTPSHPGGTRPTSEPREGGEGTRSFI